MGHIILVFGTLIALNFGIGYQVSDELYEDQGVVEIQELATMDEESNHKES